MKIILILASILIISFSFQESVASEDGLRDQKYTVTLYTNSSDRVCYLGCTHPSELFIDVGSTVEWTNTSNSSRSFSTGFYEEGLKGTSFTTDNRFHGNIGANEKFSFLFSEPGEYQYFINEHRFLKVLGTIHVLDETYTRNDTTVRILQEMLEDEDSNIPITSLHVNPKNSETTIGIDNKKDLSFSLDDYKQMLYKKIGKMYFKLVNFSDTEPLPLRSNSGNYVFMKDQFGYNIPYTITNGTVNQITMDCKAWSLVFEIKSKESGTLNVDISKELMDPLWSVLVDYEELQQGNVTKNTISVWFPAETKRIEILGGGDFTLESGSCKKIHNPPHSFILSPLKQMKNGVETSELICKPNLELIFKETDNSPACVKSTTVEKLIERGWAPKVFISNPRFIDVFGEQLSEGKAGQSLFFRIDAQNYLHYETPYVLFLSIENKTNNDAMDYLKENWVSGFLEPKRLYKLPIGWKPCFPGNYSISIVILENIEEKKILSNQEQILISVTGEPIPDCHEILDYTTSHD